MKYSTARRREREKEIEPTLIAPCTLVLKWPGFRYQRHIFMGSPVASQALHRSFNWASFQTRGGRNTMHRAFM